VVIEDGLRHAPGVVARARVLGHVQLLPQPGQPGRHHGQHPEAEDDVEAGESLFQRRAVLTIHRIFRAPAFA
jgi:hypothetical protein